MVVSCRMFETLRVRLRLAPLPPLNLPELPAGLPGGTTRPDTLAGVGGANLLKIAVTLLLGPLRRRTPNR
jgi:hypothetical protein